MRDDAGYFLMSVNVWRLGAPVLDQTGVTQWSDTWSPAMPVILSPLARLPLTSAVLAQRLAVVASGVVLLLVAATWFRRELELSGAWLLGALLTVAAAPLLVSLSTQVLTDVPAAALALAGLVLLRRDRVVAGMLCLVLAYWLRTIDGVLLLAALLWFWRARRWRELRWGGVVAVLGAGTWTALQALHGVHGYISQLTLRDIQYPERGYANAGEILSRVLQNARSVAWGEAGDLVSGLFVRPQLVTNAAVVLGLLSTALIVGVAVVLWRRRMGLEAAFCAGTLAVAVAWPWDPLRFLLPLLPIAVGTLAWGLSRWQGRPRAMVGLGALVAVALVGGDLLEHRAVVASPAQVQGDHDHLAAYTWVRDHVPAGFLVISANDVQCRIYSDHYSTLNPGAAVPGRSYAVIGPGGGPVRDLDQELARALSGPVMFRSGSVRVIRVDRLAALGWGPPPVGYKGGASPARAA
ncbi:MAG: hypothetical protein ACYDAY_08250 [Candidatus Dormibacteria bacterium]